MLSAARVGAPSRGARGTLAVGVMAALVLVAVLLFTPLRGSAAWTLRVDDVGQLVFAAIASLSCLGAAIRQRGRGRLAWLAMAVATGGWSAGEAIWSYYEVISHRDTPFPSFADAGFLTLPVAALVGLLVMPHGRHQVRRLRTLLDGLVTTSAILVISWSTTLGVIAREGGQDWFSLTVSVAYPIGDVVVLSMVVMLLARDGALRRPLVLVGLGLGGMAVADSGFTYLTSIGKYHTGDVIDLGWFAAFALIALAGLSVPRESTSATPAEARPVASYLPFIPPALAAITVEIQSLRHGYDRVGLSLVTLSVVLVVLRQSLTVKDNRDLIRKVAAGQAELHRQAFHDALTGLANRALFADRLDHALELHRRDMRGLAVVFCDLDDFKLVNDGMGHAVGDELLIRVAERFRGTLRPGDTLARLGGDEFAILLEDGGEPVSVADRLRECLDVPFVVGRRQVLTHASIGIATIDPGQPTPTSAELMANADIAMYRAKANGKNDLCLYRPGMNHQGHDDPELSAALVAAVGAGDIQVAYQPIIALATGRIHGFEALARWHHDGRDVPPSLFIPLADRAGLLTQLTDQVLEASCAQLQLWCSELSLPQLHVGVNVAPELLSDESFPRRVRDVIDRYGLNHGQLILEVTEAGFIDDPATVRINCERLHAAGAALSLDDFGTGYSSLAHLRTIPLRSIKIDKSFVQLDGTDTGAMPLLSAIAGLAHQLGLQVVAEGIETEEQRKTVLDLKCEYGQGFLFCRPQSVDLATAFLRASSAKDVSDLSELSDLSDRHQIA